MSEVPESSSESGTRSGPVDLSRYPGAEALLGRETDAEVGRKYGVSPSTVYGWRVSRGIPAHRRGESDPELTYPGIRALLGKVPDAEVGRKYTVSQARVQQIRKSLGIRAFMEPKRGESRPVIANRAFAHLRDVWRERTGRPLGELAREIGIPENRTSDWARGTNGRAPEWSVVFRLAALLGWTVRVDPAGRSVELREPGRKGAVVPLSMGEGETW
jgi:hypothetical protein